MSKRIGNLIYLLLAAFLSTNIWGDEIPLNQFKGMQLAWASVTSTTSEADLNKSKKAAAEKSSTAKPLSPAEVKAATPATAKPTPVPVQVPVPISKPVQVLPSVTVTPPVKPAQAPLPAGASGVKPAAPAKVKQTSSSESRKHQTFQWMIGLGFDMGGEELGTVTYADGSTASVKANNGVVINAGTLISNGRDSAFSTQLSVGYKSGGPRLWNGDVNWSAIPIEIVEQYNINNWRIGAGISYQLNPQLKVNVPASSFITKYDNALGFIVQIGWMPTNDHYSIDFRYTSIKFQVTDAPGTPLVGGNAGGMYLNYFY